MGKFLMRIMLGAVALSISIGIRCLLPVALQFAFVPCQPSGIFASVTLQGSTEVAAAKEVQGLRSTSLGDWLIVSGTVAVTAAWAFVGKRASLHHRQFQRCHTVLGAQATATSQHRARCGKSCRDCPLISETSGIVTEVTKGEGCASSPSVSSFSSAEATSLRPEDVFPKLGGPLAVAPLVSSYKKDRCLHPDREMPYLCGDCPRDQPADDGGGGGCIIS